MCTRFNAIRGSSVWFGACCTASRTLCGCWGATSGRASIRTLQRIKALPELQLPLAELIAIHGAPDTGALERNFVVVYLENGFQRADVATCLRQVRRARRCRVE